MQQKKRNFAPERSKAITQEVEKLFSMDILKEVFYPTWLANPMLVKKPDNSWKMCVDFTVLSKHCPKDCYPLPNIDQKVEAITGYEVLMFLDAYKGYHQILMAAEDVKKNGFCDRCGGILLQENTFRIKKCRRDVPENDG